MRRYERAWTLLELLVALGILGILAAIAAPMYLGYSERARVSTAIADIRVIEKGVERFRLEFDELPLELSHAMKPVPRDPWGNPYEYLNLEAPDPDLSGKRRKDKNLVPINSDYDLYSRGKDGESKPPLTAKHSHDDIVRANDGDFVGLATDY